MDYKKNFETWYNDDRFNQETRKELDTTEYENSYNLF